MESKHLIREINLNNLKIGTRYTVESNNGDIIRATLNKIIPPQNKTETQLIFVNQDGCVDDHVHTITVDLISSIYIYDVFDLEDISLLINNYV